MPGAARCPVCSHSRGGRCCRHPRSTDGELGEAMSLPRSEPGPPAHGHLFTGQRGTQWGQCPRWIETLTALNTGFSSRTLRLCSRPRGNLPGGHFPSGPQRHAPLTWVPVTEQARGTGHGARLPGAQPLKLGDQAGARSATCSDLRGWGRRRRGPGRQHYCGDPSTLRPAPAGAGRRRPATLVL